MKRGTRFIMVLATSILTFGTLMATIGPKEFDKNFHRHGCHRGYEHEHHCEYKNQIEQKNNAQKNIDSI